MSTLTVKDLEELTSLKEENQSLKIQNQDLMTQLASLQWEQEQTSKDLQVSEEVNSNLRSQLSTYREELVSSRKELEALEKEVEPLLDKFKQAKEHSDKMMDFVGFQDQRINELEDMLVEFRIKRSE
jgi:chromosome segregation ATPase